MYFRIYQDSRGEWRWSLYALNEVVIANSGQGYVDRDDCMAAIALVKSSANAPVQE